MSGGIGGAMAATGAALTGGLATGGMAGIGMALGAAAPWLLAGIAIFSLFKKKPPYKEKHFKEIQAAIELTNVELLKTSEAGHKAATALKKAFGGLKEMEKATKSYYDNFFTDEEKRLAAIQEIDDVFAQLGMTVPESAEDFRAIVEAQDLMTKSGRNTYAAMIKVSESFADIYGGMNNVNNAAAAMAGSQGIFATLQDEIFAMAAQSNGYLDRFDTKAAIDGDVSSKRHPFSGFLDIYRRTKSSRDDEPSIVEVIREGNRTIAKNTSDTVYLLERANLEPVVA